MKGKFELEGLIVSLTKIKRLSPEASSISEIAGPGEPSTLME